MSHGYPPIEVKRALRREVNFGCPVPGCGNPLLTWHHFDPPWKVREHHNVEGMIALCTRHHPMADAGIYSTEQLRDYKRIPNSTQFIKNKFEWMPEHSLIRLGGCYAFDWCRITIQGTVVLEIAKDDSGLTATDLILEDHNSRILAQMSDNLLTASPEDFHDLAVSASGNRVTIWYDQKRIGFDFRYSRKPPEEIERLITANLAAAPYWRLPATVQR